jgi:polyhydroxybutyrate depolymerase
MVNMNCSEILKLVVLGVLFLSGLPGALAQRFTEEQLLQAQAVPEETNVTSIALSDGTVREYSMYVPRSLSNGSAKPGSKEKVPLLLVFHGGGGPLTSRQKVTKMKTSTQFDQLAEREHFVVVYPMGYGPHWNDERPEMPKTRDLEFIDTLISQLTRLPYIDATRVYATGISNGAFFVNYLGIRLSNRISAIASVCGPIPTVDASSRPTKPVSALLIDGTDDAKVPFSGGGINNGISGETLPHDQSVGYWIDVNGGVKTTIMQEALPSSSGRQSPISIWQTNDGALVGSVVISGGEHQWYNTRTSNFDASEFIWQFFKKTIH